MSKLKVLISNRPGADVEAMLSDAPSEVDIHFLPAGEKLNEHVSDVEILYGTISEADFPKAESLRWIQQPFVGVEWSSYPALRRAMSYWSTVAYSTARNSPNTLSRYCSH